MSSLFQGNALLGRVLMVPTVTPDTYVPAAHWRGLAVDASGNFVYSTTDSATPVYIAGLRCSPVGVLIADTNKVNFDHYGPGAAPQGADDFLIIDTINPADNYHQGVPYVGDSISVDDSGTFTAFAPGFGDGFM